MEEALDPECPLERTGSTSVPAPAADQAADPGSLRRVVVASSLGAVFEAYDLVLYGPTAAIVAAESSPGSIPPMPISSLCSPPP